MERSLVVGKLVLAEKWVPCQSQEEIQVVFEAMEMVVKVLPHNPQEKEHSAEEQMEVHLLPFPPQTFWLVFYILHPSATRTTILLGILEHL
jgi:hypothetical protein